MTNQAELDEFKVLKAQMDKHIGIQPRWSKAQAKATRKKSEIDFDKYNSVVVEDEEPAVEHEYASVYRGKVQNRKVDVERMPMYHLSLMRYNNLVKSYQVFDREVDAFNQQRHPIHPIYLTCNPGALREEQTKAVFAYVDTLTEQILASHDVQHTKYKLLQRAVTHTVVQNYGEAIDDLTTCLTIDPQMMLAYWQRGVCEAMLNEFNLSQGTDSKIKYASALYDLNKAVELDPGNPYVLYDRGNLHYSQDDYAKAIEDYTAAIEANRNLAEAYFNRGLAYIHSNERQKGIADLSKAGELGLYSAYSMIKKHSK